MKGLKKCSTNIINLGTKQKPMKGGGCLVVAVDEPVLDKNINKSPNVYKVPLKEEERESWIGFKELVKWLPAAASEPPLYGMRWPIDVNLPFVAVIRDFATTAYNEVIHKYVKKRENSIMSHPEVRTCTFVKREDHYCFCMEMEAIEQGILGDYKILVACDLINGTMTLLRKVLLFDTIPTGKIAMMLPHLNSLKSDYQTFKAEKKDIEIKLERAIKKGMDNHKIAAAKLIHLKKNHKAIKGKCKLLYREIESQIPKGWSKRSDSRDIVGKRMYRGLIRQRHAYDYYVCSPGFPEYEYLC